MTDKPDSTPTVIYILGAGASGTTVLSMMLGAHPEAVCVGEMSRIDEWLAWDKPDSSGEPMSRSELWRELAADREDGQLGIHRSDRPVPTQPPRGRGQNTQVLHRILKGRETPAEDQLFTDIVARNLAIYRHVSSRSGAKVIVDSSKDLLRLHYLLASGMFSVVPVWMVRNGLAYVESKKRRGGRAPLSTMRWIGLNRRVESHWRRFRLGQSGTHLSYESFVKDPESNLTKIVESAGLAWDPAMLNYHERVQHLIAGSPHRFEPKPLSDFNKNVSNLSFTDRASFTMMGGPYWNRRFGAGSG